MPRTLLLLGTFLLGATFRATPQATPAGTSSIATPPSLERQFFDAIRKGSKEEALRLLDGEPALIKARANSGASVTQYAVYAGHPEIAEAFIARGVEPNIFEAALTGRLDRVRALLDKDPSLIHAFSQDGWTALHLNWGRLDIVNLLLDRGAVINTISRNPLLASPLQGAVASGRYELARLLVQRGADVNCRGEGGVSPLQEAAAGGRLEFAKFLMESGSRLNERDDEGKTPLATAIAYKKDAIAALLKERGARE